MSNELSPQTQEAYLKLLHNYAKTHQFSLDNSINSIQIIESMLADLQLNQAGENALSEKECSKIIFACAAYIVDVINKNLGAGQWNKDDVEMGENSFPYIWNEIKIFPSSWCSNRVFNGPEDNIWFKFKVAFKDVLDKKKEETHVDEKYDPALTCGMLTGFGEVHPLFLEIYKMDYRGVAGHLNTGVDVNMIDPENELGLLSHLFAALNSAGEERLDDNMKIFDYLIKRGADPQQKAGGHSLAELVVIQGSQVYYEKLKSISWKPSIEESKALIALAEESSQSQMAAQIKRDFLEIPKLILKTPSLSI